MIKFLEEHSKYLFKMSVDKAFSNENREIKATKKKHNSAPKERVKSYAVTARNCDPCEEMPALHTWEEFRRLIVPVRVQKVRELGLCFNCLSDGHRKRIASLARHENAIRSTIPFCTLAL